MSQMEMNSTFTHHDSSSDEEDGTAPLYLESRGDTDHTSEPSKASTAERNLQEGMLPRDVSKRTPFFNSVEERQISDIEAKLFYQHSQTELQTLGLPSETKQSPVAPSPISTTTESSNKMPINGTSRPSPMLQSLESYPLASQSQESYYGPASGRQPAPSTPRLMDLPANRLESSSAEADVPVTIELEEIAADIKKALDMRKKYIKLSLQGPLDNPKDSPDWLIYPPPPEPSWVPQKPNAGPNSGANSVNNSMVLSPDRDLAEQRSARESVEAEEKRTPKKRRAGEDIGQDFNIDDVPVPRASGMQFRLDENGIYQVFEENAEPDSAPIVQVPSIREFYIDLEDISRMSSDGPGKSFAFRRLQYLEGKFNLYVLLNGYQEVADSKRVPHRDFYNVRKVDTHVHHSACMNQKHLLRFIKSKMKKCPNEIVLFRDGGLLTLEEVFQSINLTAYDLSIDTLDMHAHTDSFHRFDKFNLKYNPIGESRLRTIFLKTDNHIKGRYLAEITKEVISDMESSKYQMVEWRISIYGKAMDEWDKLAAWVVDNKLFSHNVRWLIQIPRLYDVYKASNLMESFDQIIRNLFQPLFEVTKDPSSHKKLHIFLQRVVGFDSVDDESKVERRLFKKFPAPNNWTSTQNPPYTYWIYFLFANMTSLNHWRSRRGLNTFVLRPHCGEAGDSEHLAAAALCCHSISHGLLLRKVPWLQYLFYLDQIGIAMSPLSNNALFLAYERNPFHQYFKRGLNVSLSTDDPLQFAFTKEPLIEEYAVAAQIYKLSSVDMCELAKNSVKQSGYEFLIKQQWLGETFHLPGKEGNNMSKTNLPDRREEFRLQNLNEEKDLLKKYLSSRESVAQPSSAPASSENGSTTTGSQIATMESTPGNQIEKSMPIRSAQRQGSRSDLSAKERQGSAVVTNPSTGNTPSRQLSWSEEGIGSPLISGTEPRLYPGVVSRTRRTNSFRESDEK